MFENQTYETIRNRILDNTNIDIDKREGSFLSNMVSAISEELAKAYINMGDILSLGFIEDSFDTYLDKRVNEFGVYRKEGTKAIGEIKVTGLEGATITNGTLVKANDLYFTVLNDIELPLENTLYVEANEVGYKYNLLANTEFELVEKNNKIIKLVNESNFENGIDVESDEDLRKRFARLINAPAMSGNKAHYEQLALECTGVGRATVYPLHNGNGSVKVMVVDSDNKPVSDEVIESCKAHIEEHIPIGVELTVTTARILNINITANVELMEGYSIEDVKSDFKDSLNDYFKVITSELTYSKVFGLLANHVGIEDISDLEINKRASSNIAIYEDEVLNLAEITLSEVV